MFRQIKTNAKTNNLILTKLEDDISDTEIVILNPNTVIRENRNVSNPFFLFSYLLLELIITKMNFNTLKSKILCVITYMYRMYPSLPYNSPSKSLKINEYI